MSILGLVLFARDMYPEVFAVGGFDDGLVEVGVLDDSVEPAVEDGLVGMGFTGFDRLTSGRPLGVRSLRNLNISSFTKGMLRGVCATDIDVQDVASVAT